MLGSRVEKLVQAVAMDCVVVVYLSDGLIVLCLESVVYGV